MGSVGSEVQATNAIAVENMNEAQLDKEISTTKKRIAQLDKAMGKNAIGNDAESKGMSEQFPLGAGGMSQAQIKKLGKKWDAEAQKAAKYVEAKEKQDALKKKLENLETAKKEVAGTGKTQAQLKQEQTQKQVKETAKTLTWKTTQKESWENGGYTPKIIQAGNIEIHGGNGFYRVFKNGKLVGTTDKLSKAKAAAEKLKDK